ncbi:type IV secretory system conjugative DNA transfer family protein [Accumulibacter sp.]|uniref:type IV secretory system conjugative DNA transfer family protein n=1 Tax=Accumulibacter sp. TaxID=2053492 RepID=UPI0035B40198
MSAFSPAEITTASFYAWEVRGRGWQVADYPVALEPPFRPCFLLPGFAHNDEVIDDGKRHTFFSILVDVFRKTFSSGDTKRPSVSDFEESEPAEAPPFESLVALRLTVPRSFSAKLETTLRLLGALSASSGTLSFEIIGQDQNIIFQVVCRRSDQERVTAQFQAFVPEAGLVETEDQLALQNAARKSVAVDIGLSREFFLPLHLAGSFHIDPYVALIPALASARHGERIVVQILFERTWNPWAKATFDALDDGRGGCVFADAPEFPSLAREKLRSPLFAVSIRLYAEAPEEERAWELARGTQAFLLQFARPGGNELIPLENEGYDSFLHTRGVRDRETFRTGMLLSAEELAGFVHLPDASVRHSCLVREDRPTKACPPAAVGHGYILGKNIHRGEETLVSISEEERLQHLWVIGASGSGKSTLLLNLILQDAAAGNGFAVLDPHGDLIDDVLGRLPDRKPGDVILFDPSDAETPVGFNILSAGSDIERTLLASDLVSIFRRLSTSWGDTMSTVLGNAVLAILESQRGGTLIDLRRFLVDDRFRKDYLESVEDEEITFFWRREYPLIGSRAIGPILTRLDTFLRSKLIRHVVGQKQAKLDLGAVMEGRKIFLAKLSQGLIGEENAYLLGSLLVSKFHQLSLARQQQAKADRTPFYLYADEFQSFATPSMESLLTGARKYRLGLVLAHQTLAQLEAVPKITSALFGNTYTRAVFRVGESDARRFAEGFASFNAEDLPGLARGEAIVRLGASYQDFNLTTFPPSHVSEAEAKRRCEALQQNSCDRYGTSVEDIRAVLRAASVEPESRSNTREESATLPAKKEVERPVMMAPAPEAESDALAPASPILKKPPTSRTQPAELALSGRGGQEHKYLQHLVKRLAEERGFRATIEEAAGSGRADVVLRKDTVSIACEISITTDIEHEKENLKKCDAAGFSQIIAIVPDKRRREKFKREVKDLTRVPLHVIGAEDLPTLLDDLNTPATTETTVRGYKVKVTRQAVSPEDVVNRRAAMAEVIARSLTKGARMADR